MTNHYAVPSGPPCRCPWCRSQQVHPAPLPRDGTGNALQPEVEDFVAAAIRQYQRERQQAEQERQRIAAEELADWLKQDVH